MTKKIFAMFLAVLMVVSMLPTSVLAAEKTCPGKGNHTAENCNNTVLGVTEPTCKVPGFTAYKCNDCGEEFRDNVTPATKDHKWEATPDKAPTCELEGYTGALKCSTCGDIKAATTIPSLSAQAGKDYDCQWEVTNPQINCLTGGEQLWKCVNCGAEKKVTIDKKYTHNYGAPKLVTAATATTNGLATRTCADCRDVLEVVVFYAHECVENLIVIKGVPAGCTTNGLFEHKECRICGTKYSTAGAKLTDKQIAALVIPAAHSFEKNGAPYTATCADTLLFCVECEKWVNPGVEHKIDWKDTADVADRFEKSDATCLKPGYIYDDCANCGVRHLTHLEALGHYTVTVSVPASCVNIAYTFTYCTRTGCADCVVDVNGVVTDKNGKTYNAMVEKFDPIAGLSHAVVADPYYAGNYFGMVQPVLSNTLFFNGTLVDGALATTNNVAAAVRVYIERVTNGNDKATGLEFNGYRMFFFNAEGAKTYITLSESKNAKGAWVAEVVLTTEVPAAFYTWNSAALALEYTTKNATYRFGTTNKSETIGAINTATAAADTSNTVYVYAQLSNVGVKANAQIIGSTFNYDGKTNSSNHPNAKDIVLVLPECDRVGSGELRCPDCGWGTTYEIPAEHNFVPQVNTALIINGEPAYKPATCVDGYVYYVCSDCKAIAKVTLPGYGHVMGATQKPVLNHETTSGYVHTDCRVAGCTYSIKGEYMVWDKLNKVFSSITDAKNAHPGIDATKGTLLTEGDCTTAKRTQFKCTCGIYVIVEEVGIGYGAHADLVTAGGYVPATCTTNGGYYTFYCTECKTYVGAKPYSATPTSANWNVEYAFGHYFYSDPKHVCEDCDSPDYTDVHAVCLICGTNLPCFDLNEDLTTEYNNGNYLCSAGIVEYYWCEQCGENHMRSTSNKLGHEYAPILGADGKIAYIDKATCTTPGKYEEKCSICDDVRFAYSATAAHVNKDGEKFYNSCDSTVEDRHCVVCCECGNLGSKHNCVTNKVEGVVTPCDCVIKTEHVNKAVPMPSTCTMPPYYALTCMVCGKYDIEVVEKINDEDVIFSGHKPAKIDLIPVIGSNGKPTGAYEEVRYPGFTYEEDYEFVYYVVENGAWVKKTDTYTAKFIERKEATYTADGYDHMYCQICKSEEYNVIEKLEGLGFELDLNAKEYTYGSLIEVIVSVNGLEELVHGFDFDVDYMNVIPVSCDDTCADDCTIDHNEYNTSLLYVGYEVLNEDFMFRITSPEAAYDENGSSYVEIVGQAANDANGKLQNIDINEKTPLVKLYFRQCEENKGIATFGIYNQYLNVFAYKATAQVKYPAVVANGDEAKALNRMFADFNNDGFFHITDLYAAMTLLTGEHEKGKTYDVTVDADKDGVVTVEDILLLYDVYVGSVDEDDLFFLGIPEAELDLWMELFPSQDLHCVFCGADIEKTDRYCDTCLRINPYYVEMT